MSTQQPQDTSSQSRRKRKAPQAASTNEQGSSQAPAKKSKRRAKVTGSLGTVLEMPFDLLLEIFGHLLPSDLLSLGRVSKEFRDLVKSKVFRNIWIQARLQLPTSPECPEDITEPMFAELAFGKSCLMCSGNGSQIHRLWNARTRLCNRCISDSFVSHAFIKRLKLPASISKMVPTISIKSKEFFSQKYAQKWAGEYHALKTNEEKAEWEKTKESSLLQLKMHSDACENWLREVAKWFAEKKARDVGNRQARLLELAKSIGWADELSKQRDRQLPKDVELDAICQKPLTDASIEKAKVVIHRNMEVVKKLRLEAEQKNLLTSRMALLQTAYNQAVKDWLPSSNAPFISDIFIVPRVRSVVVDTPPHVTLNVEHFFNKDNFCGIVAEAKEIRQQKILELIAAGYLTLNKEFDPNTVTTLATTLFGIVQDSSSQPPMREVLTISKAIGQKPFPFLVTRNQSPVAEIALNFFGQGPWNSDNRIVFHPDAHRVVSNLITMCGLNPDTTTVDELDAIDPIFECVPCNSMKRGRYTMRWTLVASHFMQYHYNSTCLKVDFLKIPNAEDTEKVRQAMKHANEVQAYARNVQMKCNHCDLQQNLKKTRRHLFDEHQIEYPTDVDWKPEKPFNEIDQHWLWPPPPYVDDSDR